MKRLVLFFVILLCILPLNAMKRQWPEQQTASQTTKIVSVGKQKNFHTPPPLLTFDFHLLPREIHGEIWQHITIGTTERHYRSACADIRAFASTNTTFYAKFNDQSFIKELILGYARKFKCSHESIASALPTAKSLLELQQELKYLPSTIKGNFLPKRLTELTRKGVDPNFIYNHRNAPMNKFTMALLCRGAMPKVSPLAKILARIADVNGTNAYGQTPLHILLMMPYIDNTIPLKFLCTHSSIQLNKQDNAGRTPLLYAINKSNRYRPHHIQELVELLLKAGADPEIPNNRGLTPLKAAEMRENPTLIGLITEAIDKKKMAINTPSQN